MLMVRGKGNCNFKSVPLGRKMPPLTAVKLCRLSLRRSVSSRVFIKAGLRTAFIAQRLKSCVQRFVSVNPLLVKFFLFGVF